jgi:hypothetical protein
MHTANISNLRSAIQEYYQADDSDWLSAEFDLMPHSDHDPHILEHEARAAELLDDDDAAWIHRVLGQNMKRAARSAN